MISDRQSYILAEIVTTHVVTGEPVSSKILASGDINMSPATVRNDMQVLENEGFITHPHTSSGRVPTDKGYRYYIEHFMKPARITEKEKTKLENRLSNDVDEAAIKVFAKELSAIAHAAVIVGFHKDYLYYTGLSNLLREPEFTDTENIFSLAEAIDRREGEIAELVEQSHTTEITHIVIGDESPFGTYSSAIAAPFNYHNKKSMICIVGPIRMNYNKNCSLIDLAQSLLK
jgi:transcriptional regulator of heat shock response